MDNNCDKDRGSEHISCWTHFYISSVGEYSSDKGYVSKKEDTFDPDELTELLGIKLLAPGDFDPHGTIKNDQTQLI